MSEARSTTDDRFKVVVAMLNEDPKLYERVKVYMSEPSTKPKKEKRSSVGEGLLSYLYRACAFVAMYIYLGLFVVVKICRYWI